MSLYVESDYVFDEYTQDSVTIDWGTSVIFVPKTYLTLVQTTPHEIYELDINTFRLKLKDLEDNVFGVTYLKTNNHNTEVSLGGLTYARVVEILSPYTITFEDGQYSVNLVGANSNVGDKINLNQVSVRSNNSAGLISSPAIEYSSFQGGVIVDTNSPYDGTTFPVGTEQKPVNNLVDALLIATFRGFSKLYIKSDIRIEDYFDLSGFELVGYSHVNTQVFIATEAIVDNVTIRGCEISGTLDGDTTIVDCIVDDINFFNGHIHNSSLKGIISLDGGLDAYMNNVSQLDQDYLPIIDMGDSGQNLVMPNFSGNLMIIDSVDDGNMLSIGLTAGNVVLDSQTVTHGTISISGIGVLVDENGHRILSGIWNGGVIIDNNLLNRDTISEANQLSDSVFIDELNGTAGTTFPIGSNRTPVNNLADAITIAEDLGVRIFQFVGDFTFNSGDYVSGYELIGEDILNTTLTFDMGSFIVDCTTKNATLTGTLTGINGIYSSKIYNLAGYDLISGSEDFVIYNCLLEGYLTLPALYTGTVTIIDSYSNVPGNDTPVLDFHNAGADVQFRNYTGGLEFVNMTAGNVVSVDLVSGNLKLADSVTNGTIVARGVGKMVESSTGKYIPTGLWNGGVDINNDIMSKGTIADAVLDTSLIGYENDNTVADSLRTANYGGYIHIDVINGVSGSTYPVGTVKTPVNNIDDLNIILGDTGVEDVYVHGDITFGSGTTLQNVHIYGEGKQKTTFTFEDGSVYPNCSVFNSKITGVGFGVNGFNDCHVFNYSSSGLYPASGFVHFQECLLEGTLKISSNYSGTITVLDSWMIASDNVPPVIDMGNAMCSLQVRNLSGFIRIANSTEESNIRMFFNSGGVKLESSVTAGNFTFTGVGILFDESASVTSLINEALMSKTTVSEAVWDEDLSSHVEEGTTGRILSLTAFNGRIWLDPNGVSGTTFPIGTQAFPSAIGVDALAIATREGIDEAVLNGHFNSTQNLSHFSVEGKTWLRDSFHFNNTNYDKVTFKNLRIDGDGTFNNCEYINCYVENVTNISGEMIDCRLSNNISIASGTTFSGIEVVVEGDDTIIDFQNQPSTVSLDVNSGIITFINAVDGCLIDLNMKGGEIVLTPSCVGGEYYAEGVGVLYNDSEMTILDNHLLGLESIADSVWNKTLP